MILHVLEKTPNCEAFLITYYYPRANISTKTVCHIYHNLDIAKFLFRFEHLYIYQICGSIRLTCVFLLPEIPSFTHFVLVCSYDGTYSRFYYVPTTEHIIVDSTMFLRRNILDSTMFLRRNILDSTIATKVLFKAVNQITKSLSIK